MSGYYSRYDWKVLLGCPVVAQHCTSSQCTLRRCHLFSFVRFVIVRQSVNVECVVGVVSDLDDQFVKSKGDRRSLQKPVSVCRSVPQFPDPLVLPTHKNVNNPDADLLDRVLLVVWS